MNRLIPCCIVFLLVFVVAHTASAQTPRVEVSAAYQATRTPDQTVPLGWVADVAFSINSAWAAVGEVSGAYKKANNQNLGVDVDLSIHTWSGGGRATFRRGAFVNPFVQLMAGAARFAAHADIRDRRIGGSSTDPILQAGGGATVNMIRSTAFVGEVDWRRVFRDDNAGGAENHLRGAVGVRFRF